MVDMPKKDINTYIHAYTHIVEKPQSSFKFRMNAWILEEQFLPEQKLPLTPVTFGIDPLIEFIFYHVIVFYLLLLLGRRVPELRIK